MSYVNGKQVCDGCGITKHDSSVWKRVDSRMLCPMCQQKTKLMEEQSAYVKEQRARLKEQSKPNKVNKVNRIVKSRPYIDITKLTKGFLIFLKWSLCFLWGGPYLLVKGIKHKSTFWTIVGVEFIALIVVIYFLNSQLNPPSQDLQAVSGAVVIVDIVFLIIGYIKFSDN